MVGVQSKLSILAASSDPLFSKASLPDLSALSPNKFVKGGGELKEQPEIIDFLKHLLLIEAIAPDYPSNKELISALSDAALPIGEGGANN